MTNQPTLPQQPSHHAYHEMKAEFEALALEELVALAQEIITNRYGETFPEEMFKPSLKSRPHTNVIYGDGTDFYRSGFPEKLQRLMRVANLELSYTIGNENTLFERLMASYGNHLRSVSEGTDLDLNALLSEVLTALFENIDFRLLIFIYASSIIAEKADLNLISEEVENLKTRFESRPPDTQRPVVASDFVDDHNTDFQTHCPYPNFSYAILNQIRLFFNFLKTQEIYSRLAIDFNDLDFTDQLFEIIEQILKNNGVNLTS